MRFLDVAVEKYGPNTALYFRYAVISHLQPSTRLKIYRVFTDELRSLGTIFWPTKRPEIIDTIIESLLVADPPMPFVFSTASATGKVTEELKERIAQSGRGLVVDWAPQVKVLKHKAVGMFLVSTPRIRFLGKNGNLKPIAKLPVSVSHDQAISWTDITDTLWVRQYNRINRRGRPRRGSSIRGGSTRSCCTL